MLDGEYVCNRQHWAMPILPLGIVSSRE